MKPPVVAPVQQATRAQLDELLALAKPTFQAPQSELLTGRSHAHWLELLGFQRLVPA